MAPAREGFADVRPFLTYLTVRECAELLRVDPKTIRSAIADGRIPVVRIGRVIRIHRSVLDSLTQQACVTPPARKLHGS